MTDDAIRPFRVDIPDSDLADLRQKIAAGELPVGSAIPSTAQLGELYGVSSEEAVTPEFAYLMGIHESSVRHALVSVAAHHSRSPNIFVNASIKLAFRQRDALMRTAPLIGMNLSIELEE